VVFRAVVFKLLVWCGAEDYVSGLQDAAASCKPDILRSRLTSSNFLPVQQYSSLLVYSILLSAAETGFLNNLITQISQGRGFFLARDVEIHTSCQLQ